MSGSRIKLAPFYFVAVLAWVQTLATLEARALESVRGALMLIATMSVACALAGIAGRGAPRGDELDAFQASLDEATQLRL